MHDHKPAALALLKTAALTLALSACTVGPDFVRPAMPVPDSFVEASPATAQAKADNAGDATHAASAVDPAFWLAFGDPQLTTLVEQALSANHDLRIALASYDRANALLRNSKFDRFPTVT
ncbi:MAG: histidine kinase, partial [Luteimonas sp.]|nr:histidine kinase [Luteimonas sp.]